MYREDDNALLVPEGETAGEPEVLACLPMFVATLPGMVHQLSTLLAEQDLAGVAGVAHRLKGAGGMYGFPSITERAAAAERSAKDGACVDVVARDVDLLVRLVRRVRGYDPAREADVPPTPPRRTAAPTGEPT